MSVPSPGLLTEACRGSSIWVAPLAAGLTRGQLGNSALVLSTDSLSLTGCQQARPPKLRYQMGSSLLHPVELQCLSFRSIWNLLDLPRDGATSNTKPHLLLHFQTNIPAQQPHGLWPSSAKAH